MIPIAGVELELFSESQALRSRYQHRESQHCDEGSHC